MGKVITPTYRIITYTYMPNTRATMKTHCAWDVRSGPNREGHGKPSEKNIERYVRDFAKSLEVGHVNYGLSKMFGFMPIPNRAEIIHQKSGEVVATWEQPSFWCI